MNKQAITDILRGIPKILKKHSPEILTGVGIAGMILTTVTAVRATPKALQLVDEKEVKDNKRLTKKEIVQTTWKCYIPAAMTGVCSIGCIIGGSSISAKRNAAIATAYAISETALKEYKEKAIEVVGPKKEQQIRDAVAKEQIEKTPLGMREVIITGDGDVLCFEPLSGRYFKSTKDSVVKAVNDLNRQMRYDLRISLNEFYDALGLSENDLGDKLGWDIDDGKGYIEPDFSTQLAENGVPCLIIGHHNPPRYIF